MKDPNLNKSLDKLRDPDEAYWPDQYEDERNEFNRCAMLGINYITKE